MVSGGAEDLVVLGGCEGIGQMFHDVSKDRCVFILGLNQSEDEVIIVVRNVGLYSQMTPHYITEGFIVQSYRCEAIKSRK